MKTGFQKFCGYQISAKMSAEELAKLYERIGLQRWAADIRMLYGLKS